MSCFISCSCFCFMDEGRGILLVADMLVFTIRIVLLLCLLGLLYLDIHTASQNSIGVV
jgi:hypothetical protein